MLNAANQTELGRQALRENKDLKKHKQFETDMAISRLTNNLVELGKVKKLKEERI